MEMILREIGNALNAGLAYLAVATALTLPDICAALEAPDGRRASLFTKRGTSSGYSLDTR